MANEASTAGTSSTHLAGDSLESTIEINIKTLDSKIYTFRVNKDMHVTMLKAKLADVTGVSVERQRLIFRGKVLKNDHLLSEYHLEDGHTLHLVARQPVEGQASPGTGSDGTAQDNNDEGNTSTAGVPRNRVGQVSHGVLLGTVNMAEQGENMVADIGRLVGAVLSSLGVGVGAPIGSAIGQPSTNSTNQDTPSAESRENQNATSSHVSGNPSSPGLTVPNYSFVQQIRQLPSMGSLYPHMIIPDSLTTLSEFMSHMVLALQNGGSHLPPDNARQPQRIETSFSSARGLPTPDMLRTIIEQAKQLLEVNATAALSRFSTRLEREGTSTDTVVRGEIQAEAMHVGNTMQHLGAMLLELGRSMMMLRMGQSPADSVVNAGPAVYISPSGPNPIMVQPFPLQANSMFGVSPSPLVTGVSGSIPAGEPSRNVNIHIHAGSSLIPGLSNAQEMSRDSNSAGDSAPTRGLPSGTVVAAIPARPVAQTSGNVLSVIYPVHVRSQLLVPVHSASVQVSNPTVSSGAQSSRFLVPQSSSGSGTMPALVAQISAEVMNAVSGGMQGLGSFSQNMQSTDAQGSQAPSGVTSQEDQTSSEAHVLSVNVHGHSLSLNVQSTDQSRTGGPQEVPPGLSQDDVNGSVGNLDAVGGGNMVSAFTNLPGTSMSTTEGQKFPPERSNDSDNVSKTGGSGIDLNSLPATSAGVSTFYQTNVGVSTERSNESKSVSLSNNHSAESGSNGDRPTPLGLGLGGLQPKRRDKTVRPLAKEVSHEILSGNQDQQSIARGQQFLHSLVSQSSDVDSANANGPSNPQSTLIGQIMDGLPLGRQGTNNALGQVNVAGMMSQILQAPAFSNLLTGVAEHTGIGSSDDLRSMLEQCTQSPAVRNMLNNIVQQVEGQPQSPGASSGTERGQGGLDFSRMIQQMMPAVSQALGRGSTCSTPPLSGQPSCLTQNDDGNGRSRHYDMLHEINSPAQLDRVVELIEQHDSPGSIFHALLESAGNLLGEGSSVGDLVNSLVNSEELTDEFMSMLSRDIHRRMQTDSTS